MHYVMLALVPQSVSAGAVAGFLDDLMAPFDENQEVPVQLVPAEPWMDRLLRDFGLSVDPGHPDYLREYVAAHNKRASTAYTMAENPTEFLTLVDGALHTWTKWNPQGKWDWWVVGGRWTGVLNEAAVPDDIHTNSLPVPDILAKGWLPHTILTPAGQWAEHQFSFSVSTSGAFQGEYEADETWRERATRILENHRDCIGIVVDYHS